MANINGSRKRGYKAGGSIKPANSPYWYTLVRIDGKQIQRATDLRHTEGGREVNRKAAQDVLRDIVTRAKFSDSSAVLNREKLTYEEMRGDYLNFYESKKRKSLKTRKEEGQYGGKEGEPFVCGLNHLDEFFAGRTAIQISNDDVSRFVRQMQKGLKVSGATINRRLSALRKMFNLARDRKKILVTDGPNIKIEMLPEPESRKGFVTHKEFLRLMGKDEKGKYLLLDHVRALAFVAYNTGMRKGELLNLRWANVNLGEGFIRLKPAETKNGKARLIPLDDETLALLTKLDPFHPTDQYVFQGRKLAS